MDFRSSTQSPVQMFLHYLRRLSEMLQKAQEDCLAKGKPDVEMLQVRLTDQMFPLHQQIVTALSFALRGTYPLVGKDIPPLVFNQSTFQTLQSAIAEVERHLLTLKESDFRNAHERTVITKAGFEEIQFGGDTYLSFYVIPNFFFHLGMVYSILRIQGVPLGKRDFDGFHSYPADFNFG